MFFSSDTDMSGNFFSCIKGVKYHFEFQEGTWDFSRDAEWERASSGDDGGTWSYFSSGGRILKIQLEHRYPLVLPQGSPISIRVARGSLRLHSSHCRPNRPHLGLCPETPCSSPVATGISGLHSRFTRGVRPRLEWKQRTPLPFELRQVSLGAH